MPILSTPMALTKCFAGHGLTVPMVLHSMDLYYRFEAQLKTSS